MGLDEIWFADSKGNDMPADASATWKSLGDIYEKTCSLKDGDREVTEHKSETSSKKITIYGKSDTQVELSLMDPDLDMMAKLFGGTITGSSAGQKRWVRPDSAPQKEFAIWMQPKVGNMVGCPACTVIPKMDIDYSSTGITLVHLTIRFNAEMVIKDANKAPNVG